MRTPSSTMEELREKYKQKRLSLNLTQEGVANKSGVSLVSLKRFEHSGQISLESLLKISLVLDCLDDFHYVANTKEEKVASMDALLKIDTTKTTKKRGRIK